jgi:hypothetical protein
MFVCAAPPLGRRPEHRTDRLTPVRPRMGRLAEHGALLLHLTWCMQKRASPGQGGVCPPPSLNAFQHDDESMEMPMATSEETTDDAMAKFTGTVTRCPPGQGTAPDAKEYGRAQFNCACGHRGTMSYPKLFKRLRCGRPMRLRCQRCGRVLR